MKKLSKSQRSFKVQPLNEKKFFKEYISESAVETRVMFFQLKKLFLSMLAIAGGRLIPSAASSSWRQRQHLHLLTSPALSGPTSVAGAHWPPIAERWRADQLYKEYSDQQKKIQAYRERTKETAYSRIVVVCWGNARWKTAFGDHLCQPTEYQQNITTRRHLQD